MNRLRISNPMLFVVGCPRSGTTLLQRMLDHHPKLAVANDTHFAVRALYKSAPRYIGHAIRGNEIPLDDALVDGLLDYHRFHRLGVDADEARAMAVDSPTYSGWIERLYTSFAVNRGKTYGAEKTPDYVRHMPLLKGLFPWAKFLHIIRDGRDVALSTLEWAGPKKGPGRWELWEREPVAACALWWRWQVETGRLDARRRLGSESYAEVRYEELVSEPEEQLRRISDFLALPYSEWMVRFHHGKTTSVPGKSAKSNWLPATPGLRDWTAQMRPDDQALFQCIAGPTLATLGLPATAHPVSPVVRRRAKSCLEWWSRFTARRTRKTRRRLEGIIERSA